MTIELRGESSVDSVGALTALGFGAAAGLHAAWARGSTWPCPTADDLADRVVGRRPFPTPAACWSVAGVLGAAAWAVAAHAGVPVPAGRPLAPLARAGSAITAVALLARGAGGLAVSGLRLATVTPEFRRNDLRIFSPLCLALGAGAAKVALAAP